MLRTACGASRAWQRQLWCRRLGDLRVSPHPAPSPLLQKLFFMTKLTAVTIADSVTSISEVRPARRGL